MANSLFKWNAEEITEAWRVADRLGLIGPIVSLLSSRLAVNIDILIIF